MSVCMREALYSSFSKSRFAVRNREKSSWPVTGLRNRGPLKDLNDSKLIVYESPIPQTSNWPFFAVSHSKPALVVLLKLNKVNLKINPEFGRGIYYLWFKIWHLRIRETMRWVAEKNTNIFPHSGLIICSAVCTQKCARICLSVIELRASPHAN